MLEVHPTRSAGAHCYSVSGPTAWEMLPLELLWDCLDDAFALGYRRLAISGGEPLLYWPLPHLLAHARELGMVTTITSTGMLLTQRCWETLAELVDVLTISIDGPPGEHEDIRRRAGTFAQPTPNLEIVRSSGTAISFSFTLTQHNVDDLEFVVRLAAEEGARSVQVHPLTPGGRSASMTDAACPDEIELAAAIWQAARLGLELGVVVHVDAITADQLLDHRDVLVPRRPVSDLSHVAPILIVGADAVVIPMAYDVTSSLRLGSLRENDLATLAAEWLAAGGGDRLAVACEQTWVDLTWDTPPLAVYWYDEVAALTRVHAPRPEGRRVLDLVPAHS